MSVDDTIPRMQDGLLAVIESQYAPDERPSIVELQRFCRDEAANHDANLAIAAPTLLEIAAAALAYQLPVETNEDARLKELARRALQRALAKVRP